MPALRTALGSLRPECSGGGGFGVERVVGVGAGIESIEGVAIVWIQGQTQADALGEVGIGDEVAAEGDEIGVTFFDDGCGGFGFESSGGDDFPFENFANVFARDCALAF